MAKLPTRRIRRALGLVEDLIFPPICGGCHRRGTWLCPDCLSELEIIPRPICARCGQPVDLACDKCAHCLYWPAEIGEVRAAYAFGGPIRDAIHRYKYQGEFARASSLAGLMFDALQRPEFGASTAWDLIAFASLHSRRRRQRGFDQAQLLARFLSERLDIPYTSELRRVIDTPSQVGRGSVDRQANVREAFEWFGTDLTGSSILIIDDVITTGATLVSASSALIEAGAARVDGIAIARELFR